MIDCNAWAVNLIWFRWGGWRSVAFLDQLHPPNLYLSFLSLSSQVLTQLDRKVLAVRHYAPWKPIPPSPKRVKTFAIIACIYTNNPSNSYTPSSMPTLLHHGLSPPLTANISSASPTCLLSLTSRLICPDSFSFIAFMASTLVGREPYLLLPLLLPCASPREPDRMSSLDVQPSLMTGNCYCRGSDDEERRLRCK
jgi:hypothetical protein